MVVSPSLASSDWFDLRETISAMDQLPIFSWHIDIEDGVFVPSMTFGPKIVRHIRRHTTRPITVHLQVVNPLKTLHELVPSDCDLVYVHGSGQYLVALLEAGRQLGFKMGLAIGLDSDLNTLLPLVPQVDRILVVSTNPYTGDIQFEPRAWDLIKTIGTHCRIYGRALAVDGGVDSDRIPELSRLGVDECVIGRAIFSKPDPYTALSDLLHTISLN